MHAAACLGGALLSPRRQAIAVAGQPALTRMSGSHRISSSTSRLMSLSDLMPPRSFLVAQPAADGGNISGSRNLIMCRAPSPSMICTLANPLGLSSMYTSRGVRTM
jgi:hypothetical protein